MAVSRADALNFHIPKKMQLVPAFEAPVEKGPFRKERRSVILALRIAFFESDGNSLAELTGLQPL